MKRQGLPPAAKDKREMQRITDHRFAELIQAAFASIPPAIAEMLQYTHFFTGTDPVYAGLIPEELGEAQRRLQSIACCIYPKGFAQNLPKIYRRTTILLPDFSVLAVSDVVHELGHALDELLDFRHIAKPVIEYAKTDDAEAFAEAFTSCCFWEYGTDVVDEKTRYLFEQIGQCKIIPNPI